MNTLLHITAAAICASNGRALIDLDHIASDEFEDASRRIVAAWNACDGIPTEALEEISASGGFTNVVHSTAHHAKQIGKDTQRAEVETLRMHHAAVMKTARAMLDAYGGDTPDWLRDEALALATALEEAGKVSTGQSDAPAADADAPIHRYLDLSTDHLDEETGRAMENGEQIPDEDSAEVQTVSYQAITSTDDGELYGHIVAVLDPCEDEAYWPECMRDCMARARALNCDYIRFDRDGQIDNALPVYDWEGDTEHPEEIVPGIIDDDTGKSLVRPRYIVRSGFAYWAMPHGFRPPEPGCVPPTHFLVRAPVLAGVVEWEDEEEVGDQLAPPAYADMLHALAPQD